MFGYNFFWNENTLVVEFYDEIEGAVQKVNELRFNKEEAQTFAKKVTFYANTKLISKGQTAPLKEPEPTPTT